LARQTQPQLVEQHAVFGLGLLPTLALT